MVFNLKGKSALVTGASGGIGSAVTRALHNQGAELIINGTRSSELEKLAAELGEKVHVLQSNLADANSIGHLAEEAEKISDNGIDILVNNAGITRDNLLVRLSDQDLMDVINLNLIAGFHLTRKIIRGFAPKFFSRNSFLARPTLVRPILVRPPTDSEKVFRAFPINFYSILFFVGSVLMRTAGCIINDIVDRNFYRRVART